MPFLDIPNTVMAPPQFTAGPTTGFVENFGAAYDRQANNDALFGLEANLADRFAKSAQRYAEITGEDPPIFGLSTFGSVMRDRKGQDPASFWQRELFGAPGFADEGERAQFERLKEYDRKLAEAKKTNPDIQTFDDIIAEVEKNAQEIEKRAGDAASRAGVAGYAGLFAGAVVGSMTWRDPLNLATLGVGGVGRTMAMRIVTEGGAQAGIEAVNQFGGVQANRDLLGLERDNPLFNIAAAGVGGAALRGAVEGAVPAYRALERNLFPERAAARMIRDQIEGALRDPVTDERLLAYLYRQKDTPEVRAARTALEMDIEAKAENPYGTTREAGFILQRELNTLEEMIERPFSREALLAETAVRPGAGGAIEGTFDDAVRKIARAENPEVFAKVDALQARYEELAGIARQASDTLSTRTVADTIALQDPITAERIRTVEAELDGNIPKKRRQELERELDMLVSNFDEAALAKAENDFRIGPKKMAKQAERRAAEARKELNKAQRAADEAVKEVVERGRSLNPKTDDVNPTFALAQPPGRYVVVDRGMSMSEQLDTAVRAADALEEKRIDLAEADFVRMKAAADAPEPKDVDALDTKFGVEEMKYQAEGGELTNKPNPRGGYVEELEKLDPRLLDGWLAHGISATRGGSRTSALVSMVREQSQDYHSGPLLGDGGKAGGGGSTRTDARFLLVAKEGDPRGVWRYVVVNTRDDALVEKVREALPGQNVVTPKEFASALKRKQPGLDPSVNGKIDIGADEPVPLDFQVPVDVGPDGKSAATLSVQQILNEFDADEALVAAMRSCAI